MPKLILPPSLAPEQLEARRLLSAALPNPTSTASPRVPPAQSAPAISTPSRVTAIAPAASNAEESGGETDAAGESDDGNENAPAAQQQQQQQQSKQGDGESPGASAASGSEAAPTATETAAEDTVLPAPSSPGATQATAPTRVSSTPVPAAPSALGAAAAEPAPSPTAPISPPDRTSDLEPPILLASQTPATARPAPFATVGELAAPELAHALFGTRALLAAGAIERAGAEAIPAILRTLIGNSGPATAAVPGPVAPSATAAPVPPDLADMADLAARAMSNVGRPDAVAAFADAIAGFAHESAASAPLAAAAAQFLADAPAHHARAWAVSAAVVTADAILIGQWYGARRRERRRRREAQRETWPFALGNS